MQNVNKRNSLFTDIITTDIRVLGVFVCVHHNLQYFFNNFTFLFAYIILYVILLSVTQYCILCNNGLHFFFDNDASSSDIRFRSFFLRNFYFIFKILR